MRRSRIDPEAWPQLCDSARRCKEDGRSRDLTDIIDTLANLAPMIEPDHAALGAVFASGLGEILQIFIDAHGKEPCRPMRDGRAAP